MWAEAEEVLRMLNAGQIPGPQAQNYFIGKGFVLFRNSANGSRDQYSIGSNILAGELGPGAKPDPLLSPEPEKSEAEKRWSAIADEVTRA